VAKDKSADGEKPAKRKRVRALGPATVARPALVGAAILSLVQLVLHGS
jgi:hypothetical protein